MPYVNEAFETAWQVRPHTHFTTHVEARAGGMYYSICCNLHYVSLKYCQLSQNKIFFIFFFMKNPLLTGQQQNWNRFINRVKSVDLHKTNTFAQGILVIILIFLP